MDRPATPKRPAVYVTFSAGNAIAFIGDRDEPIRRLRGAPLHQEEGMPVHEATSSRTVTIEVADLGPLERDVERCRMELPVGAEAHESSGGCSWREHVFLPVGVEIGHDHPGDPGGTEIKARAQLGVEERRGGRRGKYESC
ncbi:MAG: hypothetical protein U0359_32545 [Byssovorax sp.]